MSNKIMKCNVITMDNSLPAVLGTYQEGCTTMPRNHSIFDNYFGAMEDRIVEKLFNQMKHHFQSIQVDDEYLTTEEASDFLKKSKEQIYQWVNKAQHGLGDFPCSGKAGRSLRFSKKALIEWMEKNANKR